MEDIKYCKYCKQTKSKDQFQKHRGKCRPCRTIETREWNSNNRVQHNDYQKIYKAKRYRTDINFKIKQILRSRLRKALHNNWKIGSSVEMLGCSIDELKFHIESQFSLGMTWDNWSQKGWHIDHKIPLSSFDLTDSVQLATACHYSNLQPMWSEENCSKSDKVE